MRNNNRFGHVRLLEWLKYQWHNRFFKIIPTYVPNRVLYTFLFFASYNPPPLPSSFSGGLMTPMSPPWSRADVCVASSSSGNFASSRRSWRVALASLLHYSRRTYDRAAKLLDSWVFRGQESEYGVPFVVRAKHLDNILIHNFFSKIFSIEAIDGEISGDPRRTRGP